MSKVHKVCIVGSGPAGYTAAIYTARAMLNPVLVTGHSVGGQLMTTTDVENFPGYVEGVSGPKMMEHLQQQASKFGTSFITADVKSVDCSAKPFRIVLDNGQELLSHSVIVSTGAQALWLNLDGEKKLRSRGISSCPVCDGAFFADEHLLCIGGGDTMTEGATYLTRYASKVTIVHRRNQFKASKIMMERARKNPKIEWMTNTTVKEWIATDQGDLCGAILTTPEGDKKIDCGGAFICIGHKPSTGFLSDQVELDKNGYIICKKYTMTSVPGIFACGDCTNSNKRYQQAITAAGQGCQAAMDVEEWLGENTN